MYVCHLCHLWDCSEHFVPHSIKLMCHCLLFGSSIWKSREGFKLKEVSGSEMVSSGRRMSPWEDIGLPSNIRVKDQTQCYLGELLTGEECVIISYASNGGSYVFMVILDINLSVLMMAGLTFSAKEAYLFQMFILRINELALIKEQFGSQLSVLYSFQFIAFGKLIHGRGCGVFVWLRDCINWGNFSVPSNFAQNSKL